MSNDNERTIQVLFMGGPWDGTRDQRSVLPEYIDVPTFVRSKKKEVECQVEAVIGVQDVPLVKEIRYKLCSITNYPVYIAPEIDENNIVHFLLDGYRLPITKH